MSVHRLVKLLCLTILPVTTILADEVPEARFIALGDLTGGRFFSEANAISSNGEVVVGISTSGTCDVAFRWTREKGMEALNPLTDEKFFSVATAVSSDGKIVVGYGNPGDRFSDESEGLVWGEGGEIRAVLASGTGKTCQATAVSADGKVIVGNSSMSGKPRLYGGTTYGSVALKWVTSDDPMSSEDLGYTPNLLKDLFKLNANSFAVAVSSDGQVVVGNCNSNARAQVAVAWSKGKLDTYEGEGWSPEMDFDASAISFDGKTTVGFLRGNRPQFWMYRADELKTSLIDGEMRPTCVSNEAKRVFGHTAGTDGFYHTKRDGIAVVWDPKNGVRPLKDLLMEAGFKLEKWKLTSVAGITPDGKLVTGSGINPDGFMEGWIVQLP